MGAAPQSPAILPYGIIAECFRNHTVVPFLGAAASFVGADPNVALPSGSGFATMLAADGNYPGLASDSLTKISQFVEEIPADRDFLLTKIQSIFWGNPRLDYQSCVTEFLRLLPAQYLPQLIITTNYDVLVEKALEARNLPYLAISHVMRNSRYAGRFITYHSLDQSWPECIVTRTQLEETLVSLAAEVPATTLVYKMHGTARLKGQIKADEGEEFIDSIVLTESDYVEFLEDDRLNKVPSRVLDLMRRSNLLFLGYSLEDWNFRVLLQRLQRIQTRQKQARKRHWACRLIEHPDEVEQRFWNHRGVELYGISLDIFLEKLRTTLEAH
jgi:hypothetical protein